MVSTALAQGATEITESRLNSNDSPWLLRLVCKIGWFEPVENVFARSRALRAFIHCIAEV